MTRRRKVEMVRRRTRRKAMFEIAYLYKGGSAENMYSTQVGI